MKKITILLIAVLSLGLNQAMAQLDYTSSYTSLNYDISFPISNTSDFVGSTSFRGISFDYNKFLNGPVTIGFATGWNVFYEDSGTAVTEELEDNGAFTAKQFRWINTWPILVTSRYHKEVGFGLIYGGVGLGTYRTIQRIDAGPFRVEESAWQFGLAPELGFMFDVSPSANIHLGVRYNIGFEAKEIPTQSYLNLRLGIAWLY